MAQVALAWVLQQPASSPHPIVGATKSHHLPEAVAALDLHLTDDEIHALEEPYTPHGPSWFIARPLGGQPCIPELAGVAELSAGQ